MRDDIVWRFPAEGVEMGNNKDNPTRQPFEIGCPFFISTHQSNELMKDIIEK